VIAPVAAGLAVTTQPARGAGAGERLGVHPHPGLIYRPELDGLRGIAVLLVMAGHLLIPATLGGGVVGVTLFFVLSGYLITSILVGEQRVGGIRLRAFYERRARRLLPALFVFLAVLVLAGIVTFREALPAIAYVGNWARAGGNLVMPVDHTWSLAVEEQFYLLWPVVLIVVGRRVPLLVVVIVASAVLRAVFPNDPWALAASRFDAIAWGCLLGLGVVPRLPRAVIAIAIGALVFFTMYGDLRVSEVWGYTIVAPAAFAVMTVLLRRPTGPLAWRPLAAVGRISYGLYLWHYPIAAATVRILYTNVDGSLIPTTGQVDDLVWKGAAIALTFIIAIASWFLVERWFLVRRRPLELAVSS
jgi:peptidoglycan/LPS O-acetylase OafA/YrhL